MFFTAAIDQKTLKVRSVRIVPDEKPLITHSFRDLCRLCPSRGRKIEDSLPELGCEGENGERCHFLLNVKVSEPVGQRFPGRDWRTLDAKEMSVKRRS